MFNNTPPPGSTGGKPPQLRAEGGKGERTQKRKRGRGGKLWIKDSDDDSSDSSSLDTIRITRKKEQPKRDRRQITKGKPKRDGPIEGLRELEDTEDEGAATTNNRDNGKDQEDNVESNSNGGGMGEEESESEGLSRHSDEAEDDDDTAQGEGASRNRGHFIRQTIAGPVCDADGCEARINGHALFFIDRSTITRHFQKNKCNRGKVNASELAKSLLISLRSMHMSAVGNDATAFSEFQGENLKASSTGSFCPRCGYASTPRKVKDHIASKKSECKGVDVATGTIYTNRYGFKIPERFLMEIVAGRTSPLTRIDPNICMPVGTATGGQREEPQRQVGGGGGGRIPQTPAANNDNTPVATSRGEVIVASPSQMTRVTAAGYVPREVGKNAMLLSQLERLDAVDAQGHTKTFLHLALQPGDLMAKVRELVRDQQSQLDPAADEPELKLLLDAGELWLKSEAANLDVTAIKATNRTMLYEIGGGDFDSNGKDLVRSKSFYETKDTDSVLKEFRYLVQFLFRRRWPKIDLHKAQALEIYESSSNAENDQEQRHITAEKIVDTDIIPGLIMTALLDEPTVPNGPNIIDDHLAARSAKLAMHEEDDGTRGIELRGANDISRGVNCLLRLVRHAVCSHLVRRAKDLEAEGSPHLDFEKCCEDQIRDVQRCPSTEAICTRIRTALDIGRKRARTINKMIDPATGDIKMAGTVIKRERWSRCIPLVLESLDEELGKLFPATDLLKKVLDVRNPLVLNGEDSHVIDSSVGVGEDSRIELRGIIPSLIDTVDIRGAIDKCFALRYLALAYLGVGAARGTEADSLPEDLSLFDLVFNSLHYQMGSEKGQLHGQNKNTLSDHYISPSLSRRIVVTSACLLPALLRNTAEGGTFSVPDKNRLARLANILFKGVMGADVALGPRNNRQAVASMCNFICPQSTAQLSADPSVAKFFHHSQEIHSSYYQDQIVSQESDGVLVGSDLMIARKVWRAMGEETASFPSSRGRGSSRGPIDPEVFNIAARTIYRNPMASVTGTQRDAILHFDDEGVRRHAVLCMQMGTGKSGVYNIAHAGRALDARPSLKTLVISPHNGLMVQHTSQSNKYLGPLGINVLSLGSSDFVDGNPPVILNFDILFMTIHTFNTMMEKHKTVVESWNVKAIFIDEFHNVLAEFFRFGTSWGALKDLSALGAKIICMSATANRVLIDSLANFLGMGECDTIGDARTCALPDVWLKVRHVIPYTVNSVVATQVVTDMGRDPRDKYAYHIIVRSKDDATGITELLKSKGVRRIAWITSDSSSDDRKRVMDKWSGLELHVLVSTIQDGIDCSKCKRVYLAGGAHSVVALVQACGRIRPKQQGDNDAVVYVFDGQSRTRRTQEPNQEDEEINRDIYSLEQAGVIQNGNGDIRRLYKEMFCQKGYRDLILSNDKCIKKAIADVLRWDADLNCGKCSYCVRHDDIMEAARIAQRRIDDRKTSEEYVDAKLDSLSAKCYKCENTRCDGTECLGRNPCYHCHTSHFDGKSCEANPQNLGVGGWTGSLCRRCYVPHDLTSMLVQHSDRSEGTPSECDFKDRAKRILLYKIQKASGKDSGKKAAKLIHACSSSKSLWYQHMAENMKQIDDDRIRSRS